MWPTAQWLWLSNTTSGPSPSVKGSSFCVMTPALLWSSRPESGWPVVGVGHRPGVRVGQLPAAEPCEAVELLPVPRHLVGGVFHGHVPGLGHVVVSGVGVASRQPVSGRRNRGQTTRAVRRKLRDFTDA